MDDPIKEVVAEAVHGKLAARIRAKVKEKWGPDPNDLPTTDLPGANAPHITGVEIVPPGPVVPGVEPVPRGILKEIIQRPRESATQCWEMILVISGCEVKVTYAMSDVAIMTMKTDQAEEVMLREMINRGASAVMELLRKGIAEDLVQMVKEKGWTRTSDIGGLAFLGER